MIMALIYMMLLSSCQGYSDGRMLKKFLSRFNAEEYDCASTYVYPADRMNLAFFQLEIKKLAPHAFIELKDYKTEKEPDGRSIHAQIKWKNATPALKNYFDELGLPLDEQGLQNVVLKIKDTTDGETLSFVWGGVPGISPEDLSIASVVKENDKPLEVTYIRPEPNINSEKLGEMGHDLVVGPTRDDGFMRAYIVDKNGNISTRYIKDSKGISLDKDAFFSLGIFDSMGLIVALIIIIAIIVPIYFLGSLAQSITSLPLAGPVIIIGLILGIIYVVYQLLEKILFELFIINLPG